MEVEQNKAMASQFYKEIINKVFQNPSGKVTDSKHFPGWTSTVLPGIYVKINDIMAEDDKVVACFTIKATYRAILAHNIDSPEKQIVCNSIDIKSIVDGKIKEYWDKSDLPGLLKQMGIISGNITTIKEPDYNLHPQY